MTADPAEARELLVRTYGARLPVHAAWDTGTTAPVRFSSFSPDTAGGRRWNETTRFAEHVLADPGVTAAPLSSGPPRGCRRSPGCLSSRTRPSPRRLAKAHRDTRPETVRRAVSFIKANAGRDITVGDIAAAAYVSSRAAQLAFRRHLNTRPLDYLRRVRLELAHEELRQAAPSGAVSVTAVAFRWGFASPSRFAGRYRAVYGELPSPTPHG